MKSISIVALAILMAGCSTTVRKSQNSGALNVRVQSDLEADVEVDMSKSVRGVAKQTTIFGLIDIKSADHYAEGVTYNTGATGFSIFPDVVETTKSAAAYNAVKASKVDVIVAPQYQIHVKSYGLGIYKEVTAEVTGYAGYVRGIKKKQRP